MASNNNPEQSNDNNVSLTEEQVAILKYLAAQGKFKITMFMEIQKGAGLTGDAEKAIRVYRLLNDLITKKLVSSDGDKTLPVFRIEQPGREWLKNNDFID